MGLPGPGREAASKAAARERHHWTVTIRNIYAKNDIPSTLKSQAEQISKYTTMNSWKTETNEKRVSMREKEVLVNVALYDGRLGPSFLSAMVHGGIRREGLPR